MRNIITLEYSLLTTKRVLLKKIFVFVLLFIGLNLNAQERFYPMQSFYKDRLYHWVIPSTDTSLATPTVFSYNGGSFFPETERQTMRIEQLNLSVINRKWFGRKLLNEHFAEIKGKDYFITIDPIIDVSSGRNLNDIEPVNYYQNTRGIEVKGDILDNISFFSNLRETQQLFLDYQSDYIASYGEYYPGWNGYHQQNGVVPGAGRTKPFKVGAYDFAYVTGAVTYRPLKQLGISVGNNMHFVGSGYRSILLSDHGSNAPYVRFSYAVSKKLTGESVYAQHLNLLRSTLTSGGTETMYEKKGYTAHYVTYKPTTNISISVFEGTVWDRGDSIEIRRVHGMYYNPIPVANSAILGTKGNRSSSIVGLNLLARLPFHVHLYGQFALDDFKDTKPAYQLGFRWSQPFNITDLFVQGEYNVVPLGFYGHQNTRLNYIHNNLPLAHPFGSGFSELVGRISYEWKRIGLSSKTNMYSTTFDPLAQQFGDPLYVVNKPQYGEAEEGRILIQQLELLYRFNRKSNLQLFATVLYRASRFASQAHDTFYVGFGFRTQLSNHYFDF